MQGARGADNAGDLLCLAPGWRVVAYGSTIRGRAAVCCSCMLSAAGPTPTPTPTPTANRDRPPTIPGMWRGDARRGCVSTDLLHGDQHRAGLLLSAACLAYVGCCARRGDFPARRPIRHPDPLWRRTGALLWPWLSSAMAVPSYLSVSCLSLSLARSYRLRRLSSEQTTTLHAPWTRQPRARRSARPAATRAARLNEGRCAATPRRGGSRTSRPRLSTVSSSRLPALQRF